MKKNIRIELENLVRWAYDSNFATVFDAETRPFEKPHRLSKETIKRINKIIKRSENNNTNRASFGSIKNKKSRPICR